MIGYFVEREVDVMAQTSTLANVVKIGLSQIRPKLAVVIAMHRKVQNSQKEKAKLRQ